MKNYPPSWIVVVWSLEHKDALLHCRKYTVCWVEGTEGKARENWRVTRVIVDVSKHMNDTGFISLDRKERERVKQREGKRQRRRMNYDGLNGTFFPSGIINRRFPLMSFIMVISSLFLVLPTDRLNGP
jgi:hypothetical protein